MDHGLHRLPGANVLLGIGAKFPVDLFDHSDLSYVVGDDAQVGDVFHFYAWSFLGSSMAPLNISAYTATCETNPKG